jgi:uncharacterized membrane protein (UPF0127 family)
VRVAHTATWGVAGGIAVVIRVATGHLADGSDPETVKRPRGVAPPVRVVHEEAGGSDTERVLATDVAVADGLLSRARGLMLRRSVPDDYALVFRFDGQSRRGLHMLFVPFAIDAVWLADGVVQRVATLSAWTGRGSAVADTVVELSAGAAAGVEAGDRVRIESSATHR